MSTFYKFLLASQAIASATTLIENNQNKQGQGSRDLTPKTTIANHLLLSQFLEADEDSVRKFARGIEEKQLLHYSNIEAATNKDFKRHTHTNPIVNSLGHGQSGYLLTTTTEKYEEYFLALQKDLQLANALYGVEGVLEQLKLKGLHFTFRVVGGSEASQFFGVYERRTTTDWKLIRKWLVTGATLYVITILGMKLYTANKKIKDLERFTKSQEEEIDKLDLQLHEAIKASNPNIPDLTDFDDLDLVGDLHISEIGKF